METLKKSIKATCIHGITGKEVEEVTLEAGLKYKTETREESSTPGLEGNFKTTILVTEKDGRKFRYTTWEL
ncbi:MAG: hypothetical protein WC364_13995 [Eubacteriales bacterium]|jgi:signal recognition particle subunit SEC65